MHPNSMAIMRRFIEAELNKTTKPLSVLDVGSYDVNGCYRGLIPEGWEYVGLDIAEGPNVDIVVEDPYDWSALDGRQFDLVVSGQCLEHVEYPWLTMEQIRNALRVGGKCHIVVPSKGHEHRYPIDCYRYMRDGMAALAKWAGLEVVAINRDTESYWGDLSMVARRVK